MWSGLARTAAVTLLLVLGPASVARAHGVPGEVDPGAVTHRDTPAELAGANISRALATGSLTSRSTAALPQYLPATWCGTRRETDDTTDAAFPPQAAQIKVVYAYAADQPDHSALWSDSLQGNVANIEQYLALQSGGRRALRFDMGTACGPQYVDIQVVALTHPRLYYLDNFGLVANDVRAQVDFAAGPRNVFILADDLTDDGVYGTGEVLDAEQSGATNAHNGGDFAAIMWVPAGTTPNSSGWQPTVALHEMSHNLGAVGWTAPHSSHPVGGDASDGTYSHCWDGQDVMCYDDGPYKAHAIENWHCPVISGAIPQTYDCGHDDYYAPEPAPGSYLATHWNVYDSDFMGSCTELLTACGADIVPTPPVNQGAPGITGSAQRGAVLTATAGTWLNRPSSYAINWQRGLGAAWTNIPGATTTTYVPAIGDVGAPLRVIVTAANGDGAAVAASSPTAPVTDLAAPPPTATTPPAKARHVRIRLRDRARRTTGTLIAKVRTVSVGREVSTATTRVALPAGTWRLRLCAGPIKGSLRCTLSKRVRTRRRGVRLPGARIVVRSQATLRVTAAAVDARQRVRAHGQAASI
jgi:hypothetical protein